MRRLLLNILVFALINNFSVKLALADINTQTNQVIPNMELIQGKVDDRGTDVTNIYTINVSNLSTGQTSQALLSQGTTQVADVYMVVLFVDNQPVEVLKDVQLPMTITRNFKGLGLGRHDVRVEVEDSTGKKVSTQTTSINVKIKKQGLP